MFMSGEVMLRFFGAAAEIEKSIEILQGDNMGD